MFVFFFSSRRRHTRLQGDWSSDVCSSDLLPSTTVKQIVGPAGGTLVIGPHVFVVPPGALAVPVTIEAKTGASPANAIDRKSTRLNSSHLVISYAVFCLKKKKSYTRARLIEYPYAVNRIHFHTRPSTLIVDDFVTLVIC